MTREEERIKQIEKFASQCYEDGEKYSAFISGAIWADNNPVNMWHDMSEEPRKFEYILFEYISNKNELKYFTQYVTPYDGNLLKEFEKFGKCRWAYISDLLPKGGER